MEVSQASVLRRRVIREEIDVRTGQSDAVGPSTISYLDMHSKALSFRLSPKP